MGDEDLWVHCYGEHSSRESDIAAEESRKEKSSFGGVEGVYGVDLLSFCVRDVL